MFMFNSNKPIKVTHLQKLANQSLLNGALVMEIANNSFSFLLLLVFKSFTAVIFYYVGQKPPDVQWRNEKNEVIKTS